MLFIIGFVAVAACVLGGYAMHGGKLAVLWQPSEFIIILGSATGAFIISNPPKFIKGVLGSFKRLLKPSPYKKSDYIDLLVMQYSLFRLAKTKGMLELEGHIEDPNNSAILSQYPKFLKNHHAVDFLCDYLRMLTMGVDNHYEIEDLMDKEIDAHHDEDHKISASIATVADSLPALGIVAAVLGVIVTMGSISEPPEILGKLVGAALVGTFLGVLASYGFVGPMARYIEQHMADESQYILCIKEGILAHMKGNAPAISVEFARKILPPKEQPSFEAVDEAVSQL